MYPRREVFPSSPLALVTAEIRFTDAPRLRQQVTLDAIAVALEPFLPVQSPTQQLDLALNTAAGNQPQLVPPQIVNGRILKDVKSTAAMTLLPNRLSFETTAYTGYEDFRSHVVRCIAALVGAGVKPAIQRVGLRYIDEIRVPGHEKTDVSAWSRWVDSRLIDQLQVGPANASVVQAEGFVVFRFHESTGLNFRFGALPRGAVVQQGNLVRSSFNDEDPFFVLDFDGYRTFESPDATLLSEEIVAVTLDAVHGPSGEVFQNSITDQSRELFRKKTP